MQRSQQEEKIIKFLFVCTFDQSEEKIVFIIWSKAKIAAALSAFLALVLVTILTLLVQWNSLYNGPLCMGIFFLWDLMKSI